MATPSAACPNARSGGKILRPRRVAGFGKTPYERPLPDSQPSNINASDSNWLARLVLPPTRFIANGAGSLISSIFRPSSASTSDYSSDSGSDYSEDDEDEENKGDELDAYVDANSEREAKGEEIHPQDFVWSSDSKRMIAKLLSGESFSREECDKLKNIIESRVSDSVGSDVDGSDLRSTAIVEAKRWIEEKKFQTDLESEMCVTNFFEVQNEGDNKINSPVDVAKSYMQALPPWSSSSVTHIPNSPSPSVFPRLSEQSPLPSVSKQGKQSPLSGSWSILEEVSKVRSKATEDLLKSRSSLPGDNDEPRRIAPSQTSIVEYNQVVRAADSTVGEDPTIEIRKPCDATIMVPESNHIEYNNGDVSDPCALAINCATKQNNSNNGHFSTDASTEENNYVKQTKKAKGKMGRPKSVASSRVRGRHVTERKKELREKV